MELSGFPHTGVGDTCYFPAAYIQKYLNDFTDHFNLRPHIKASQIILSEIKKYYIYSTLILLGLFLCIVSSSCRKSKTYQ